MKTHFKKFTGAALVLSLWGSSVHAQQMNTQGAEPFPDVNSTYLKTGDFINIENLRKISLGLHKYQVRRLLRHPHFNEGISSPRTWNYVFNFYTGAMGGSYITCQYQIHYDEDYRIDATYWKDKQCEDFINGKPNTKPAVAQPLTLSADGMFAFGKSGVNDVMSEGRQKLAALAQKINTEYNVTSLQVVGHTDRIGSNEGNMALSRARAETVKTYLVQNGVPAELISAKGAGSSQPEVNCPGATSPAVVACLQPNRRVELTLTGTAK